MLRNIQKKILSLLNIPVVATSLVATGGTALLTLVGYHKSKKNEPSTVKTWDTSKCAIVSEFKVMSLTSRFVQEDTLSFMTLGGMDESKAYEILIEENIRNNKNLREKFSSVENHTYTVEEFEEEIIGKLPSTTDIMIKLNARLIDATKELPEVKLDYYGRTSAYSMPTKEQWKDYVELRNKITCYNIANKKEHYQQCIKEEKIQSSKPRL